MCGLRRIVVLLLAGAAALSVFAVLTWTIVAVGTDVRMGLSARTDVTT
ncbi:MAG: hypothetical protein QN163_04085 [Armatimonadota bacterium]|nr:hypothetical protein [Armatimonadota bacterium]